MTSDLRVDGEMTMRLLAYLMGVMRWLAGQAPGPPKHRPPGVPLALREFVDDELRAEAKWQRTAASQPDSAGSSSAAHASRPPPEVA